MRLRPCQTLFLVAALLTLLTFTSDALASSGQSKSDPVSPDRSSGLSSDKMQVGTLVGAGFPRPLSIEGLVTWDRLVTVGIEYGGLPDLTVSGIVLSSWTASGEVSLHPTRGAFYFGLRAGHQHIEASTLIGFGGGQVPEMLGLDTFFLNPRAGFLWHAGALAIGLEAGVQFPLNPTYTSTADLNKFPQAQQTVNQIGGTILPTIDLLRIGLMI